jgi:3-methyladenine DNA glycosylase AlkD
MKVSFFIEQLKPLGNLERALAYKSYHKSNRKHFGITAPLREKLTRNLSQGINSIELIQLAKGLWESDLFDPMMCAAKILSLPQVIPSQLLWETIVEFLKRLDRWALEDSLSHAAWKCLLKDMELLDEIEKWTKEPNFWMKRAALVYTLPLAKPKRDPERVLSWASEYSSDPEWFIQKAIGWWLRVLGEHNPERVILFLETHWLNLKGVARKEATRKLNSESLYTISHLLYRSAK